MDTIAAANIAIDLMEKHGLYERGWQFEYRNYKSAFGMCHHGSRVISLSRPGTALREEHHVRNTILHEIAHALVGPNFGHDSVWRTKALSIGCNGERCSSDVRIPGIWQGTCKNGHTVSRHRKPKGQHSCSRCAPYFSEEFLIEFKRR